MTNQNEPYDIVLANGRVIDPETYLDDKMHVGIRGDRIAAVSELPMEGKQVIDASVLIVAPGFIDTVSGPWSDERPGTRLAFIARSGTVNVAAVERALNGCQARLDHETLQSDPGAGLSETQTRS
jgi:adenine deaminase